MLQDVYVQQDNNVVETRSKIARIQAHKLANIPITPPPYRDKPNKEGALLLQVETNDGLIGWATSGYTHHVAIDLINKYIAPTIIGDAFPCCSIAPASSGRSAGR
ncbi:hypothetical protein [Mesorhizobium sp.]|uniref:hypothetical protein n=1 Tax=Mesorhizobium sp. TaxID=1871066 RepID=UPI0025F5E74E|nr:hypothetical protein [Mesorhizobium sp.]